MRDKINNTKGKRYVEVHFFSGQQELPPVVLELFEELCPQTVNNFLALSKAIYEPVKDEKAPVVSYKDSEIHRICPGMFI